MSVISLFRRKEEKKIVFRGRIHDHTKEAYWLGIAGLALMTCIIGYGLWNTFNLCFVKKEWILVGGETFIFHFLGYFTNITNIMVWFYFICFVFFYKSRKLFDTNEFLILVGSYITVVFLIYWLLLVPGGLATHSLSNTAASWVYSAFFHGVSPVYFFIFSHYAMRYPHRNIKRSTTIGNSLMAGNFFPALYMLYAFLLNNVSIPRSWWNLKHIDINLDGFGAMNSPEQIENFLTNHNFLSVYGISTAMNPRYIQFEDFSNGRYLYNSSCATGDIWYLLTLLAAFSLFSIVIAFFNWRNNYQNTPWHLEKKYIKKDGTIRWKRVKGRKKGAKTTNP
ncbi:MAG: hypothetical protein LBM76_01850 [Mycoplasmataceae bacterium]|jgi:hypothetical protein|nr:hypothetical protein [Mycoplasmataceae bacterium]